MKSKHLILARYDMKMINNISMKMDDLHILKLFLQSVYSECVLDVKCAKCNTESFWSEGNSFGQV